MTDAYYSLEPLRSFSNLAMVDDNLSIASGLSKKSSTPDLHASRSTVSAESMMIDIPRR